MLKFLNFELAYASLYTLQKVKKEYGVDHLKLSTKLAEDPQDVDYVVDILNLIYFCAKKKNADLDRATFDEVIESTPPTEVIRNCFELYDEILQVKPTVEPKKK